MAAGKQPLGPRRFDFGLLDDGDFELLSYLVVLLQHDDAIRLRAPDKGADAALPRPNRTYSRCWQSKRFTGHISWTKCKESLDAAVEAYAMPHYTFCFAKDLTGHQEELFKFHLASRHKGVRVDYWGAGKITGLLLGSAQGQRIERHFYGDPEVDTQALIDALRAGGELSTGADALARLQAIADFLESHDPFFAYGASTRPTVAAEAAPLPGSVMSVEMISPETTIRIDAVPRNRAALDRLPGGRFLFDNTPEGRAELKKFQQTLARGGETTLRGVGIRFDQLPSVFEGMAPAEKELAEITIRAERARPAPWDARVLVETNRGKASIDVYLEPSEPPAGWDGALAGSAGGLTISLLMRERANSGEVQATWRYRGIGGDPRLRGRALAVVDAVHGAGTLTLEERADGPRSLAQTPRHAARGRADRTPSPGDRRHPRRRRLDRRGDRRARGSRAGSSRRDRRGGPYHPDRQEPDEL